MLEGENLLNKIKTGYVVHSTLDSEAQANLRIDLTTTSEITLVVSYQLIIPRKLALREVISIHSI